MKNNRKNRKLQVIRIMNEIKCGHTLNAITRVDLRTLKYFTKRDPINVCVKHQKALKSLEPYRAVKRMLVVVRIIYGWAPDKNGLLMPVQYYPGRRGLPLLNKRLDDINISMGISLMAEEQAHRGKFKQDTLMSGTRAGDIKFKLDPLDIGRPGNNLYFLD